MCQRNPAISKWAGMAALTAEFAGSWRFQDQGNGVARVIFRYRIAANPRWQGIAFEPILKRVFGHDVMQRLVALKRTVDTSDLPERMALAGAAA